MSTPPFAMAPAAAATCTAETSTSCPMAMVGFDLSDQACGSRSSPAVSPGRVIPVRLPKPNCRSASWKSAVDTVSDA